jgi:predicted phage tail protein
MTPLAPARPAPAARRGVKTKILGAVLMILGALNGLLTWRGGLTEGKFYVYLFAAGVAVFAIGAVRQAAGASQSREQRSCRK